MSFASFNFIFLGVYFDGLVGLNHVTFLLVIRESWGIWRCSHSTICVDFQLPKLDLSCKLVGLLLRQRLLAPLFSCHRFCYILSYYFRRQCRIITEDWGINVRFLFPAFGGLLYGYDIGATSSATISIQVLLTTSRGLLKTNYSLLYLCPGLWKLWFLIGINLCQLSMLSCPIYLQNFGHWIITDSNLEIIKTMFNALIRWIRVPCLMLLFELLLILFNIRTLYWSLHLM